MTHQAHISSKNYPGVRRWTVETREVRTRTPAQEQAIRSLDPDVLGRVLEIWLRLIAPGAVATSHRRAECRGSSPSVSGQTPDGSCRASAGACSPPEFTPSRRQTRPRSWIDGARCRPSQESLGITRHPRRPRQSAVEPPGVVTPVIGRPDRWSRFRSRRPYIVNTLRRAW